MAGEPVESGGSERSHENKKRIEREFVRLRVRVVLREAALLALIPYGEVTLRDFEEWARDEYTGAKYDLEVGAMRSEKTNIEEGGK